MRQRDYPTQFLVRDAIYELFWKRDLSVYGGAGKRKKVIGWCDGDAQKIIVQSGLSNEDRMMVVVHELLHAVEFEYEIRIPHALINRIDRPIAKLIIANFAA